MSIVYKNKNSLVFKSKPRKSKYVEEKVLRRNLHNLFTGQNKGKYYLPKKKRKKFSKRNPILMSPQKPEEKPFIGVCKLFCVRKINRVLSIADYGTGFFISPYVVATAAHCLIDRRIGSRNKLYHSVIVVPVILNKKKRCNYPLGGEICFDLSVTREHFKLQTSLSDYGVIFLNKNRPNIYEEIDFHFNIHNFNQQNSIIHTAGYENIDCRIPSNSPLTYGSTNAKFSINTISHNLDTNPGHSGMPIWIDKNGYKAVGINHRTPIESEKIKITEKIENDFTFWNNLNN